MFDSNNQIEVNKCINFRGWKKGESPAKSHIYFSGSSRRAVLQLQSFSFCAQKCWSVKFLTGHLFRVRIGYSFRACIPNISKWDCCDETKLKTDTANQLLRVYNRVRLTATSLFTGFSIQICRFWTIHVHCAAYDWK